MAFKLTHGEYVKFVRTTAAIWATVPAAQIDEDTLYFVLSPDRTQGDLYLGTTLITGINSSFSLSDLTDVLNYNIEGITNGSVLMFNSTSQKWEVASIFDVLQTMTESLSVMGGATNTTAGTRGLVPDQPAGSQDWFLSGSGNWVNPAPIISEVVGNLAAVWFGDDWDNTNKIIINNQTIRDIASSEVAKIVAEAPGTFDTLKEIADWIETQPTVQDISSLSGRVQNLETTMFTDVPADVVTGTPARPSILTQISTLNTNYTNLDQRVTTVENTLRWQLYTDED